MSFRSGDDLADVVTARHLVNLKVYAAKPMRAAKSRLERAGLIFTGEKMEAV